MDGFSILSAVKNYKKYIIEYGKNKGMLGCFGNFQSTNDYCMSYHCISVILLSGTQVWPKRMIHVCGSSAQCVHGCIVQDPL